MKLSASDFYTYYRPSKCELRVYLRHVEEPESPPGPYEQVIFRLGQRHEQDHLASFPSYVDLRAGTKERRRKRTLEQIKAGANVIYHGVLEASVALGGTQCEISGEPDFLVRLNGGYAVRDSKVARRTSEKDHPEIACQLELYGWLFQQTTGRRPAELQIHSGTGEIVALQYQDGAKALALLQDIAKIKAAKAEPYSPVGWTKCATCGFHDRCWARAEKVRDVALLVGVDQGLAIGLREEGIRSISELIAGFDEDRLAGFERPWGRGLQRVGKRATMILLAARAMDSGKEIILAKPRIPRRAAYAMFDLEGLPPQQDDLGKIYLWGLKVYGIRPGPFLPATAGFGTDGDREGWEKFLGNAARVFREYNDVPFVHWHHYERVHIDAYIERYGDPDGVATRVRRNLVDLLPIAQESVVLPLPSYSLKVVEKHVGFKRSQEEYGGDWAMAKFVEATECGDRQLRDDVMKLILTYNEEDLEATWAVFQWLRGRARRVVR